MHNGAAPDALIGGRLITQHFLRKLKTVGGDFNDFAALCVNLNRPGARLEHERGVNVIALGFILQGIFKILFRRLGTQLDVALCAPVTMPAFVIHDARAHCGVGSCLMGRRQCGMNFEAARIDVVMEALVQDLAHHLREVVCFDGELVD